MEPPLVIAGVTVPRGERVRVEIPVARLFTQQMLRLPIVAVHGAREGPRLWVTAAIHGDEINGTEIARRVVDAVDPATLAGTLLVVPVANVWGFLGLSRYLPDRRDLNRCFPGSPRGSLASQLASLLLSEVVEGSDCGIDLHAGSRHRTNLPQARGDLDDPRVLAMGCAFGAPVTIHAALRPGSIRAAAARRGIPCLLYEAGGTLRFEDDSVEAGTRGVLRVMEHLGMRAGPPFAEAACRLARATHWVRAPRAGVFHRQVAPGDMVAVGDPLGVTRDIFGDVTARVRSRHAGLVIGAAEIPLVNRGDALVHVAEITPSP